MEVGVLAALISLGGLIVVSLTDRAVEFIVRNFAASRLQFSRRVPVVHDSDTWLPHIPRSIIKYHKYPGTHYIYPFSFVKIFYFQNNTEQKRKRLTNLLIFPSDGVIVLLLIFIL